MPIFSLICFISANQERSAWWAPLPPWHPPVRRPPWMFRGVYSLGQMQNLNRQLFVYSILFNSDWKLFIKVIPNSWRVPIHCQFPNPLALGRASGLRNLTSPYTPQCFGWLQSQENPTHRLPPSQCDIVVRGIPWKKRALLICIWRHFIDEYVRLYILPSLGSNSLESHSCFWSA